MKIQPFCIAVCDDEPTDRRQIEEMTEAVCREESICPEITCFGAPDDLLKALQSGQQYHLFLLDVVMPVQSGMELARQIRRERKETPIVFISGNREMAMEGYEVSAIRYLAKPLKPEKLREAVAACYKENERRRDICIPENGSLRVVSPKDVACIELSGRKCRICQRDEVWETRLSLGALEEMLQGRGFIRCHQSFLVNCRYIRRLCTSSIELADGRDIPVSKHRLKEVRQAFFDYMQG